MPLALTVGLMVVSGTVGVMSGTGRLVIDVSDIARLVSVVFTVGVIESVDTSVVLI